MTHKQTAFMADVTNRANTIVQIQAMASREGAVLLDTIETAAAGLARMMQAAHGGEWRIQVEHEAEFIMIARRAERRGREALKGEGA